MELYCTRSGCPRPQNYFVDLDDSATLRTVQQKYCTACGMPLILVGRYLPLRLLGQGGFGAAFLARDRYTPGMRQCVVKQFKPSGDLSSNQLELAQKLFEREAEVLEELGTQHDQIPNLFAFFELSVPSLQPGKQDSFFYLVQEFIDGKNLEEELQQKGKFSEPEVLELLRAILPVLQFVHEHGSIHRDIKPSNIMRHRNGKLYLLDFGAVKQVTKVASAAAKGSTGIYSMGFAPPEQMAGGEVYPSTDLYALAVSAVMLLTGKEAAELFDVYSNQWNWRTQAQVSNALANVLDRMLSPAPNQRFQSAQEVIAALPSPAPPASPASPAPPAPPAPQSRPAFSTLELLTGAGFSGFEGGLIAIALYSLLRSPAITLGVAALILGGLIFAQTRRWIEKWDLLIIAGISLAIIFLLPILRSTIPFNVVAFLALAAGLIAIALIALFRLIYKLLSLIL
ncbi:bifunctional serine/threonine protein kinase/MFS transporter [Chroococcidiopsis sp. CCMEE 29]|uniref:bifunctional serine/threonine protein kinase/MFS transporter n=1 Tax=Chroococcidiopsis sp. CCMEE 29 TaxID=155894 RepID=UPI002021ECF8|nr:bifunctional serine/threonine protein kinase/MFS transporter [Chroococcidiopsis sp. CCMEE 29]